MKCKESCPSQLAFRGVLLVLIISIFPAILFAQKIPPKPTQWVMDYAGILNNNQEQQLDRMLRAYEDSTSNQIVVAVFPDAQGYPVEEYSIRVAEAWKIGQKGRNNGIILAIFMKEHKIRVEVGYGLEDKVPDAIAIQIAQNIVSPQFKKGDYFKGIQEGCRYLMATAAGKFKGFPQKRSRNRGSDWPLVLIVFFIIFLLSSIGRGRRGGTTFGSRGWRSSGPFFWGGFGGFGGGGSFGGGGGGGFSAGGGSFGGGGATGSW
ncbi:MAG: TPM domain-containing protein [Calditrichia bacterium]